MSPRSIAVFILLIACTAPFAAAQNDSRLMLDPWLEHQWGQTLDKITYQAQASVQGTDNNAQIFWWDSTGRFRFDTDRTNGAQIGYRWVTMNLDTNDPRLPDHLDEISMAFGTGIGHIADGDLSIVVGAGYSGNNPFADPNGVFGLAHLIWQKQLDKNNSLALTVDWNGMSALLPDIPLPGFAWMHQDDRMFFKFGFPRSEIALKLMENLTLEGDYAVPYTADLSLDYALSKSWHLYAGGANFFNAYRQDDQPQTDRLFYQMSRVEAGIRFVEPDFVMKGAYLDASLVVGYAFEQHFYDGFDVRGPLTDRADIEDVPYIGLIVRGRF